ncbi:MAG: sigma-54-dependent Fis family transcriptional regulator [Deltaproteobacteria bacterium]|nr:sigma-54-dependent Fis family transcriptional regulator [Deltaproteobacteria bacterium]
MQIPLILIADDNEAEREALAKILKKENYRVIDAADGEGALEIIRREPVDLLLTDLRMPRLDGNTLFRAGKTIRPEMEVILMTAYGTVDVAVSAMKGGAYDFLTKPFKKIELVKRIRNALEKRALQIENKRLSEEIHHLRKSERLIGKSPAFRHVLDRVDQAAPSGATVLLTGESGTGKELIADLIHRMSIRKDSALVKINCAALPDTLLESELFGHEKGAFTGALSQKPGRFELAHGGTLFLDEIAEMAPRLQAKLLRVLQIGEFERVGGVKTLRADVRIIAATNRDLKEAVSKGDLREDLFYRLNVINIHLPPLRERREDIPLLANYFAAAYREKEKKEIRGISADTMNLLCSHSWPGNVRELENVIERAVVLSRGEFISAEDLPRELAGVAGLQKEADSLVFSVGTSLGEIEQKVIEETLRKTGGNRELAAKVLGISTRTLYRRVPS